MNLEILKIVNAIALLSIEDKINFETVITNLERILCIDFKQSLNELPKDNSYILAISAGSIRPIFIKNIGDGARFRITYKSWCYIELFDKA
jgi:hypothetical protein